MERLFHETIENWDDWSRVYQSVPAFSPLVEEICRRERLPFVPPENLTPGTNAVFRVGDTVVKIFFPIESGLDPEIDFANESAVCGRLTELGFATPRLLAKGCVEDRYRFWYLVTEFDPGMEAGDWLKTASPTERERFARELRELLPRLNRPAPGLIRPVDLLERAVTNHRLDRLSPALAEEMRARAAELDLSEPVLVHGDLTGENILIGEGGEPVIIDCADACLAPFWYEYAPLVFELFRCDPAMLRAFAGEERERFLEQVLDAVCIHDFGADCIFETARREGRPLFSGLKELKEFLAERLGLA